MSALTCRGGARQDYDALCDSDFRAQRILDSPQADMVVATPMRTRIDSLLTYSRVTTRRGLFNVWI